MNKKIAFLLLLIVPMVFAEDQLAQALGQFCGFLYGIVGQVAFVMILLSSVIFTVSQFFGAETRARGNVWATSMLTGAIVGILMVVLVPWFLGMLVGGSFSFDAGSCTFSVAGSP